MFHILAYSFFLYLCHQKSKELRYVNISTTYFRNTDGTIRRCDEEHDEKLCLIKPTETLARDTNPTNAFLAIEFIM